MFGLPEGEKMIHLEVPGADTRVCIGEVLAINIAIIFRGQEYDRT
jgi:hypothetical protein